MYQQNKHLADTLLCDAQQSLLFVVDIQQRLTAVMPTDTTNTMLHNTKILLLAAECLNIPVIVTEQYPKGLGSTVTMIKQSLPDQISVFEKTCFSCCGANGVIEAVEQSGRKQLIIVGQETHVCVLQTALQLKKTAGFAVFVVDDATCSRKPEHHLNAIERMRCHGVEISNHESILFEWLRDASHPHFKQLSRLIR